MKTGKTSQSSEEQDKTNRTGSMSDKSLMFDLCVSEHNTRAIKQLLLSRPAQPVRADLSKCHGPTFSARRKLSDLDQHQAEVPQEELSFLSLGVIMETVMQRE